MTKYIITFPGQGSQSIGMMDNLSHVSIVKETFDEAAGILNKDFWAMSSSKNEDINQQLENAMRAAFTPKENADEDDSD